MNALLCDQDIRRERHGMVRAHLRGGVTFDTLRDELRQPRETLKRSAKSWTYRLGDWVVKESRFQKGLGVLKRTFQRRRYRRAWQAASFLAARGVLTPEPIAYLEYGALGVIWKNAMIVRYLDGFDRVEDYAARLIKQEANEEAVVGFLACLGEAVRALVATGAYHSDLAGKNILTKDGRSFYFVDLDAVRLGMRYTVERRMRNHVQLYDSFWGVVPEGPLIDFIAGMAPSGHDVGDWMRGVQEGVERRRAGGNKAD